MTLLFCSISALFLSLLLTPVIKKVAFIVGAVDAPNARKVHTKTMPRLGGVAIFLSFLIAYALAIVVGGVKPTPFINAYLLGSLVIVFTGIIDDIRELSAKEKLLGQLIAGIIVVVYGFRVDFLHLPFAENVWHVGWLSIPITILWIVGVTNAVNLIDGLDGLAAGVSGIACISLLLVSLSMGNMSIALLLVIMIGSIAGFLFYNFHPAKIFMGDSGSMFLGFSLSVFSLLELKQVTLLSFVIPILVLAIPLSDTFYAILRRILNRQPISKPDKNHLHHTLLHLGFSHRKTVLLIYGISLGFGLTAVLLTKLAAWLAIIIIFVSLIAIQLFAELTGLMSQKHKPLLTFFQAIVSRFK